MKILVTGGTGFIGFNVALALEKEGNDVTVVDIDTSRSESNLSEFKGEIIEADVSEKSFWDNLDDSFEAINHQAACADTTVMDEVFMNKHNVEAFEYLLDWARDHNADVVYASSAATYGNAPSPQRVGEAEGPLNPYGVSKLKMDEIVRKMLPDPPIKIIGLRYFNVYGPREAHKGKMASMIYQLAQQMKAGKNPRIFTDGEQRRDQIFIGDVIQSNLLSLKAPKEASGIYNVGTGNPVSFNEIISELNEVLNLNLEPDYFECPYDFYQEHTQADISDTKNKLGFEPGYSLKQGVEEYSESGRL